MLIFFNASLTSIFLSIINYYQQEKAIKIIITKGNFKLQNVLKINGLFDKVDYSMGLIDYNFNNDINDTYIPLKRFKNGGSDHFLDYIEKNLKNRHFTNDCLEKIISNLIEIFSNFKDHSSSEYFYISGQFFPNKHKINICLTDKGIGLAKYIMSKVCLKALKSKLENIRQSYNIIKHKDVNIFCKLQEIEDYKNIFNKMEFTDYTIKETAKINNAILITNDNDFYNCDIDILKI